MCEQARAQKLSRKIGFSAFGKASLTVERREEEFNHRHTERERDIDWAVFRAEGVSFALSDRTFVADRNHAKGVADLIPSTFMQKWHLCSSNPCFDMVFGPMPFLAASGTCTDKWEVHAWSCNNIGVFLKEFLRTLRRVSGRDPARAFRQRRVSEGFSEASKRRENMLRWQRHALSGSATPLLSLCVCTPELGELSVLQLFTDWEELYKQGHVILLEFFICNLFVQFFLQPFFCLFSQVLVLRLSGLDHSVLQPKTCWACSGWCASNPRILPATARASLRNFAKATSGAFGVIRGQGAQ